MRRLLTILFSFCFLTSFSQQPYLPSTDGTSVNRPLGATGFPTDGRSKFHDRTNFLWRDYRDTTEVLATLVTSANRDGNFFIFIHSGGTLGSNGLYLGGTQLIYWFKDGLANSNLVPFTAGIGTTYGTDSTYIRGATLVNIWGNSLAAGTGGTPTTDYPNGSPYAEKLKLLSGYNVVVYGVSGQISPQVLARFVARPDLWYNGQIFEFGTNNKNDTATVLANVRRAKFILDSIGNPRYLFTNIPGQSASTAWSGTAEYISLQALNTAILSIVGSSHYVDVRAALVAAYNPALSQDVADHSHDIPPTSLMYSGDVTHYNDAGYSVWATTTNLKMGIMKPNADQKAVGTSSLLEIFKNAPPLKTPITVSRQVAINFTAPSTTLYTDGNGNANPLYLQVNGGMSILNNTAPAGQEGGIHFRPQYNNLGGFSTMVMMGTNPTYWNNPVTQGFGPLNHQLGWQMGGPFTHTGLFTQNGDITSSGTFNHTGGLYPTTLSIGSSVTHTASRPVDFSYAGNGMLLPYIGSTQHSTKLVNGNTYVGELYYNLSDDHAYLGVSNGAGYGIPRRLALFQDIPFLPSGIDGQILKLAGGMPIWDDGANGSTKMTGTAIGSASFSGYEYDKAFDNNTTTAFAGSGASNYAGLDVATTHVLTKVRVWPREGLGDRLNGRTIQGSNTSSSSGFVDLFVIPSAPPDYQYTTYSISSTTPYRYFRVNGNAQLMDVAEIEFYGYEKINLSVTSPLSYNAATGVISYTGGSGSTDTSHLRADIDNSYYKKEICADSSCEILITRSGRRDTTRFVSTAGGSGGSNGTGDVITNTSTSVDNEVALFSGTNGKTLKRSAGTGIARLTSGVLSASIITVSDLPLLGGYVSGTGTITSSDSYFTAIQKLNGNIALKANQQALQDSMAAMRARDTASTFFNPAHFSVPSGVVNLADPLGRDSAHFGHIIGRSATPTLGSVSGAGTSPTTSLSSRGNSTDLAGTISIVTGSTGTFTVLGATVSYTSGAYSNIPHVIVGASSSDASTLQLYVLSSLGGFTISSNNVLAANKSYSITYHVIQ